MCIIFCPLTLLTTCKIKILKKWNKKPGDMIILHFPTTNDDHMMYRSWDMEHDRHNFLSFWGIFCPFILLTTNNLKNQNFEKTKKWKNNMYSCSGPPTFKSGNCRLRFSNCSCYEQNLPISDVNYVNKEY